MSSFTKLAADLAIETVEYYNNLAKEAALRNPTRERFNRLNRRSAGARNKQSTKTHNKPGKLTPDSPVIQETSKEVESIFRRFGKGVKAHPIISSLAALGALSGTAYGGYKLYKHNKNK